MTVLVIDGKGGGLGAALITRLRERLEAPAAPEGRVRILALGTNAAATAAMLRAGADDGATGGHAIARQCALLGAGDAILGPLAILASGAMLGEVTRDMAAAIAESAALKVLIPTERCGVAVVGVSERSTRVLIDEAAQRVLAAQRREA